MIGMVLLVLAFAACTWCIVETRDRPLIVAWCVVCVALGVALPTIASRLV